MSIVEVDNLWVRYPADNDYTLKGVSLEVREGEFILITGPSGCGKTTLSYCLTGIIPKLIRAEVKGSIKLLGMDVLKSSVAELARNVGIVFQDPEMQLVTTTVYEEVVFPLENRGIDPEEIKRRAEEVLEFVGLKGLEDRSPQSLSGGQKQALAIASAIALRPKVLILDEPTSQLDPQGTSRIVDLIVKLKNQIKTTIIAIEHRIEWAVEHIDRMIVMHDGRIISEGKPEEVFSNIIEVEKVGFRPPQVTEIYYELKRHGIEFNSVPVRFHEGVRTFKKTLETFIHGVERLGNKS